MPIKTKSKNSAAVRNVSIIIVAAIVVFLGIIILAVMAPNNTGAPLTTCTPNNNFNCFWPLYSSSTGNFSFGVSYQSANTYFYDAKLAFIPLNSTYYTATYNFPWNGPDSVYVGNLTNGTVVNITLPISGPEPVGTMQYGTLWMRYRNTANNVQYIEIAEVKLGAT